MGVSGYSAEFKDEAIKHVTEKERPVIEVAKRLGVHILDPLHMDEGGRSAYTFREAVQAFTA